MALSRMAVKGRRASRRIRRCPQCRPRRSRKPQKGGSTNVLLGADAPPLSSSSPNPVLKIAGATNAAPFQVEATVQAQPVASWQAPPPETYYTLVAWDPDASAKSWLHWLVTNITGPDPTTGEEVVAWSPPTPPPATGPHRYIFGLFSHEQPLDILPPPARANFQLGAFAAEHALTFVAFQAFRVKPAA
jgi:phosphatidylethanolamine-binding protein (PEBP) family uncharacterized protein